MRLALVLCVCFAVSCHTGPTDPVPAPPPHVNVAWRTLVRDRQTAAAYAGHTIRFRLDRADCVFEGNTVRVWYGDRNVPPVLIIVCAEPPTGNGPYTVVGLCGALVPDGVRRGLQIDFALTITAARVTTP